MSYAPYSYHTHRSMVTLYGTTSHILSMLVVLVVVIVIGPLELEPSVLGH